MKTSELEGQSLDWVVAKCAKDDCYSTLRAEESKKQLRELLLLAATNGHYTPSTNWAQGGPIIERERIEVSVDRSDSSNDMWYATIEADENYSDGEGRTPLIAAMRCYVASKLGNEVEIPENLK